MALEEENWQEAHDEAVAEYEALNRVSAEMWKQYILYKNAAKIYRNRAETIKERMNGN